jgi:hypothetical protein
MTLQERLIQQSHAIRSFPILPVKNIVDQHQLKVHDEVKTLKSNITEYLKPYVDEVLEYVKDNDEMMLKLWDGIHDAIMFTPIHDKIYDDIISDNEY